MVGYFEFEGECWFDCYSNDVGVSDGEYNFSNLLYSYFVLFFYFYLMCYIKCIE